MAQRSGFTRRGSRYLAVAIAILAGGFSQASSDRDPDPDTERCTPAQRAVLDQLARLPAGQWQAQNRNRFDSVWTPPALQPLNSGELTNPGRLITAWGGFAWDRRRSALWLFGGGHADYSGNEVYRWSASDGLWQRASLPSEIAPPRLVAGVRVDTAIDGVDHAPAAAHSYDNNVYLPRVDRLLSFGGAAYNGGGAWFRIDEQGNVTRTGPYLFDVSRADPWTVGGGDGSHVQRNAARLPAQPIRGGALWQNRDSYRNHLGAAADGRNDPLPAAVTPTHHVGGCSAYADEAGEDVVYVVATLGGGTAQHLFRYRIVDLATPGTDRWEHVGRYDNGAPTETACAFDPVGRYLVRTGSHGKPFSVWSLQTPGPDNPEQIVIPRDPSGRFLPRLAARTVEPYRCGIDFDSRRQRFWLWCGGGELWQLSSPATAVAACATSSPAWCIQPVTVRGTAQPDSAVGHGVFGKWSYAPELDVFVALQNGYAGNVWFFKPDDWQPACAPPPAATH